MSDEKSNEIVSVKTFGQTSQEVIYVSTPTPIGRICDPSTNDIDADDQIIKARDVIL